MTLRLVVSSSSAAFFHSLLAEVVQITVAKDTFHIELETALTNAEPFRQFFCSYASCQVAEYQRFSLLDHSYL